MTTTNKKVSELTAASDLTGTELFYADDGTNDVYVTADQIAAFAQSSIPNTTTATLKDANLTIQDDGDTSKRFKFEASGITSATTRTITIPDADTTLVGTDATQTLSSKTLDNSTVLSIKDANFTIQDDGDTTKRLKHQLSGITTATTRTATWPDADLTVVGIATTQSLTNKTLDNTNTITLKDTLFTLQDDGDTTKQLKHQLSGITTGTTRTVTWPDADLTVVGLTTTQTLTNKTLTAPVMTTPTLGVAAGTSLALGGATIGTDALGATGTGTFSGQFNAASFVPSGSTVPTNGIYLAAANTPSAAANSGRVFLWTSAGGVQMNNAAGSALTNVAATSTAPTLVPNRADTTTGIGAQASGNMSMIVAGVEKARVTSTGISSVPYILAHSGTIASVTGTLVATTLVTVTIPANAMGANGAIRIVPFWSNNNSANNKTFEIKFGGTTYYSATVTTSQNTQAFIVIRNNNATNSQKGFTGPAFGNGAVATAMLTSSVDTTSAVSLTFVATLANTGDTASLEGYTVELLST